MQIVNNNVDSRCFNTARRKHPRNLNVTNSRGGVRM